MKIIITKFEHTQRVEDAVKLLTPLLPDKWKIDQVEASQFGDVSVVIRREYEASISNPWRIGELVEKCIPHNDYSGRFEVGCSTKGMTVIFKQVLPGKVTMSVWIPTKEDSLASIAL